jgi:DNA polymerase III subunit delta'
MPSELWPRVIGQHRVKQILLSALRTDRLAHAYLFFGGEGVGKDAVALELARVLHCEKGGESACDVCPSCLRFATLQHPDVHVVVPLPRGSNETKDDGPLDRLTPGDMEALHEQFARKGADPYHRITLPRANIIKVNSIRDLRREVALGSSDGRRKVFIISAADSMGEEAANMLLKTLEEPIGACLLILTTAHRDALLPTILSRCQEIRFDPLTEEELSRALIARRQVPAARAALVARLANGSFTHALELLGDDLQEDRQQVLSFLRSAVASQPLQLGKHIEQLAEGNNREGVTRFLMLQTMWLRDALVLRHGGDIINTDQQEELQRFVTRFPHADLHQAIAEVERAISLVDRNVYIRLILVQLAIALHSTIVRSS